MSAAGEQKEKIEFKAEVAKVLNLVVNSLYSHKEVFLRELISNASDAIDKHRHHQLTEPDCYATPENGYKISILPDKEAKTLTISDNGIGMNREEVIEHLGTIASSGTKAFIEKLQNSDQNADLIGQFGVGFYSAFMVAERVVVETKRAGQEAEAITWESSAEGGYTLESSDKKEFGTTITLYIKDDEAKFLEDFEIKSVVKKYSDYVSYPISLPNEKKEDEVINKSVAIWRRPKNEIKDEEYAEFYKYISHDFNDPLTHTHHSVEGMLEYRMLLFIPSKAPMNLFQEDIRGLRLHVKKMFITDECKELLPVYLRFVKGVVDSEDLPLNISRETLQQDTVIPKMRKQLVKKVFDMIEDLLKNKPDEYQKFYKEFGGALKEGLTNDFENRERIVNLLRYSSSKGKEKEERISLKEYVERMQPDQKEIYYLSAPSYEACLNSPHLELFKKKDIEVLFMIDVIDEWATPAIGEYDGKKLKPIGRGDIDLGALGEELKKEKEESEKTLKLVTDRLLESLKDTVKDVRISVRLNESPSVLVAAEGDTDANMEQIMKAMGQDYVPAKRILEINAKHPIITQIQEVLEADPKDARLDEWASLLYHQAVLMEGTRIENPAGFVHQLNQLLEKSIKN